MGTVAAISILVMALPLAVSAEEPARKPPPAAAQAGAPERVYEISDGVKPPRLMRQVNPDYSKARGVRVKGSVEIGAVITSQGATTDVQILKGLAPEVDRSAVEAVKQWRFAPAEKDGKPVAVKVSIELEFHPM
jgi:TonB family protein